METTVVFNSPKLGKITITFGKKKAVLTYDEYLEVVPKISKKTTDKEFFKMLKLNIKNYFAGLK